MPRDDTSGPPLKRSAAPRQALAARLRRAISLRGDHRSILLHFCVALAVKGLSILLQLAQSIVLSRFLGPAGVGLYFLAGSALRVGATVGALVLPITTVRMISDRLAGGDGSAVRRITWISLGAAAAGGLAVGAGLFLAADALAVSVFREPGVAPLLPSPLPP